MLSTFITFVLIIKYKTLTEDKTINMSSMNCPSNCLKYSNKSEIMYDFMCDKTFLN